MSSGRLKYYILLHATVFIFGFTGILGKLLTIDSFNIVLYRMLIAFFGLLLFMLVTGRKFKLRGKRLLGVIGIGGLIAAHWITFFTSIHVSNVSIALACISSAAFFTALIEPVLMKKKLDFSEIIMGVSTVVGITIITQAEFKFVDGIILSLISAFLAALFGVLNAKVSKHTGPVEISAVEMLSGGLILLAYLLITGTNILMPQAISMENWGYLITLGLVATSFAFVATVYVLRELTPFTIAISINLEPIYAIIIALLMFPNTEKMNPGFYLGAGIIISTILLNAYLKRRKRRKLQSTV